MNNMRIQAERWKSYKRTTTKKVMKLKNIIAELNSSIAS